ncbi:peptide chain release factor 1 [Pantoea sp. Mhis]|uniref:peptide chain release factor 1 n=1 Tax=Pantoea sp. Mhis TaxID=2576759 RepID=UPI0013579EA5|nr:peptide chain release factor 1 [Pantoea sp. Mhis]MXP56172.1 peptide chain release factor 1 [Pantoea sp. Mhis]
MKQSIFIRLETLQERYEEIESLLSNKNMIHNQETFCILSREHAQLTKIINCFYQWKKTNKNITDIKVLLDDHEMHNMAQEELKLFQDRLALLETELSLLLLPKDIDDQRSCFIEIHAGTGGHEAAIFAGDLFRMYNRYAEMRHWKVEIITYNEGEQGGYKEITARIIGNGVYGALKFESGGHRVQRVPETESQGRVHTSSCSVAVIPELPEAELSKINLSDLRIDTFRSSGAGGQHVNTTDSAIRITHLPTGIVAECQDERSQHKNKAKALAVLGARIHAAEKEKYQTIKNCTRRNLLGTGDRSDRIRTYNFSQSRITDHRINLTVYRLEETMEGKLDILIKPISQEYQAEQLSNLVNEKN